MCKCKQRMARCYLHLLVNFHNTEFPPTLPIKFNYTKNIDIFWSGGTWLHFMRLFFMHQTLSLPDRCCTRISGNRPGRLLPEIALFDTALFKKMNILFECIFWILKKMNILFEWIFWILKKWIFCLNEYSGF